MTTDLRGTALAHLETCIAAARRPANVHAFINTSFDAAIAAAATFDASVASGIYPAPLGGWIWSIKDLFDVQGEVTGAGSRVLAKRPAAAADCPAVARLRQAGALFIGRTNMSEFAYSGLGLNPHFGTPANPATLAFDVEARVPGGSTSGGAVTVATGAADAALGSDTGGSIRIPAAFQGLVGFKNTARLTPTAGVVPLSTSLDTVCAITRTVGDAVRAHEVLAARRVRLSAKPAAALRLAVPTTAMLDGLDDTVRTAFTRSVAALVAAGVQVHEIAVDALATVPNSLSAPEAWAWHRQLLREHEAEYDPRVAMRIRRGEAMSAADYIDLLHARKNWIDRVDQAIAGYDALISPTVAVVAPLLAPLIESDAAFTQANMLVLRNTSIVNVLDGCALSLPCHRPDEMPVGLMVWHGAMQDDAVLSVSLAIESVLADVRT